MDHSAKARCPECRSEVVVPDSFGHGDLMGCGTCRTGLKVLRKGQLRVVHADAAPLRDRVQQTRQRLALLESDFAKAKGSLGIGVNGIGVGLAWAVYQVALEERLIERALLVESVLAALVGAILLEVANLLFLAKRKTMARLTAEIGDTQDEMRALERKLKDAAAR